MLFVMQQHNVYIMSLPWDLVRLVIFSALHMQQHKFKLIFPVTKGRSCDTLANAVVRECKSHVCAVSADLCFADDRIRLMLEKLQKFFAPKSSNDVDWPWIHFNFLPRMSTRLGFMLTRECVVQTNGSFKWCWKYEGLWQRRQLVVQSVARKHNYSSVFNVLTYLCSSSFRRSALTVRLTRPFLTTPPTTLISRAIGRSPGSPFWNWRHSPLSARPMECVQWWSPTVVDGVAGSRSLTCGSTRAIRLSWSDWSDNVTNLLSVLWREQSLWAAWRKQAAVVCTIFCGLPF